MVTRWLYLAFLGLIGAERCLELLLSRRNAARALGRGGVEAGRGHLPLMKALHGGFLLACGLEVTLLRRPFHPWLAAFMLALTLGAQALRYWAVLSLGRRWNIRVIAVPGEAAIDRGPYRYLRHPNYLAVIVEGIAIPLVHSAWLTTIAFTMLDAWLLAVRIRSEEELLTRLGGYRERLGDRPRLLPGVGGERGRA